MAECKETRIICAKLQALGCMIYPLIGGKWTPIGWPDRYISSKGWSGFLEFKAGGKWLNAHQDETIRKLLANGDQVYIVDLNGIVFDVNRKVVFKYKNARELLWSLEKTCEKRSLEA